MTSRPPKRVLKFLRWFCREDYIDEIEGDLTELFEKEYKKNPAKARLKFTWHAIQYFRPEFIKSFGTSPANPLAMIKHNTVITYRNFLRNKSSFIINLAGLTTGLTAALLIYLWVSHELAIDKFHKNDSRLFQVLRKGTFGGDDIRMFDSNSDLLAPAIAEELPDVEYVIPVAGPFENGILTANGKSIKSRDKFAGKDFFNVFSYELLHGDPNQVLADKYSIVISDALAKIFFDDIGDAVGKTVVWDETKYGDTYTITGVFKKPTHASEDFDFLLSNEMFLFKRPADYIHWDSNSVLVYLVLKEGISDKYFSDKLDKLYKSKLDPNYAKEHPEWIGTMFIERFSERYLYNRYENGVKAGGRIDYVILFSLVGIFILIIACINFINLSTARASRRLKEIGVKKAIGAHRRTLVFQYVSESMLLSFFSMILAIGFVLIILPQFNILSDKQLTSGMGLQFAVAALIITILTGLIAGSYPALYLSGFSPIAMLKGKSQNPVGEFMIRKGLVVFQFCLSILFIVSVIVIYEQINYVQTANLGYDKENIIIFSREGKLTQNSLSFENELKSIPGVLNVSGIDFKIGAPSGGTGAVRWEGKDPDDKTGFNVMRGDTEMIELLGVPMKEGRSFSSMTTNEEKSVVIFNEMAIREMGMQDPIGKKVMIWGSEYEIIGVTKDFHIESLYKKVEPCFFFLSDNNKNIAVRIKNDTEHEALSAIEKIYHTYNPGVPFDYKFADDAYQALYTSEQKVSILARYGAGIAVFISCLGLFGLVAYTGERKAKEIGIRKLLGCTEVGIIQNLSGEFTKTILLANLIALPISLLMMKVWLQNFAYRIELHWSFFIASGLATLFIAWLTIGLQTLKLARANPIKNLRSE